MAMWCRAYKQNEYVLEKSMAFSKLPYEVYSAKGNPIAKKQRCDSQLSGTQQNTLVTRFGMVVFSC